MKKIHGLTILETEKEVQDYFHCSKHEFVDAEPVMECVNPNGELVVGYGCKPVSVQVVKEDICVYCGFRRKKKKVSPGFISTEVVKES